MKTVGAKIGLVATLLLIVGSALVWDSILRGRPSPAPHRGEGYVVFEHGGPPIAARSAPRPPPPRASARPATRRAAAEPRPPEPPRTWTVREGESLSEIAERVYGESRRWREIARVNRIDDPDLIRAGQVLRIP